MCDGSALLCVSDEISAELCRTSCDSCGFDESLFSEDSGADNVPLFSCADTLLLFFCRSDCCDDADELSDLLCSLSVVSETDAVSFILSRTSASVLLFA